MAKRWPSITWTANRRSKRRFARCGQVWILLAAIFADFLLASAARACPFCNAVQPSLAQQRESAAVVAIGEFSVGSEGGQRFRVHQALKGADLAPRPDEFLDVESGEEWRRGQLALLLAAEPVEDEAPLLWRPVAVDETVLGYFAKAPTLRIAAPDRLRYFARYLEHADPRIAEDAYLEFGHAPYDEVAKVADALPSEQLKRWLADERVPQHRKGFYALALGLPRPAAERAANLAFLRSLVVEPTSDFRAGFDGVIGAYLLAGGSDALKTVVERMIAPADAPEGDTRHAIKAIRFYHEFGREVPPEQLAAAVRLLLARPGFAAEAIADLARWQDWDALDRVVAQYDVESPFQAATRRSVIGYLAACPRDEADNHLARLRAADPDGVTQILEQLGL